MVEWKRELLSEHYRSFDYLITVWIFFLLFGVIFRSPLIFAGAGVLSAYMLLYCLYERTIGKRLILANDKKTIKMFPGDDVTWQITATNTSPIPLIHGELHLKTGSSIKILSHDKQMDAFQNQGIIPLSLRKKSESVISISVNAMERGVAKVDEMTLIYPHLFHFKNIFLVSRKSYRTEFVVYPTPIPVQGIEKVLEMTPGEHNVNVSPFEDILTPKSIRDYQFSDSFHRINWQASLKTGRLQTNEYAKVVQISYVIVVNLQTHDDSNMVRYREHIEKLIAYAAHICRTAAKKDISYALYVNARKLAKTPFVHLTEGKGRIHYGHAMEMLARIHKQPVTIPLEQMLHHMSPQLMQANVMILIGDVTDTAHKLLQEWRQRKMTLLQVTKASEGAVVKQIG